MAEVVTTIVAEIAGCLVPPILRQLRYVFCVSNIVTDLEEESRKLTVDQKQVQIDVERARGNAEVIKEGVEMWQTDTIAVIAEVESIVKEAEDNKSCLTWLWPNWCWRYRLGRKAAKTRLAIVNLQDGGKFTQVGDPAILSKPYFFSSADFSSSQATESATQQIREALRDENVNMIGLHGMGGVGKTTLVNELGGWALDSKLFDVVVTAVVSQTPNVKHIQGQIADVLRLKFEEETVRGRALRLCEQLKSEMKVEKLKSEMKSEKFMGEKLKSEMKILIILDDVWAPLDLKDIGIPFGNDHKGCKILLTTRRLHVCTAMKSQKTIKLDVLLEHEAWALFKKNTGLGNDDFALTTVAAEVARECKGLPLAIVTVGRALEGKTRDEYTEALEELKNSRFEKIPDVYACLKLSYDYLKHKEMQSCFLLCSLFPEDYEIDIEDLARIGWGIGLFKEAETIEAARRKMRVMMKTLQNSGLLIDTDTDQFVKMHDMVRDVALGIASEGENVFMVRTGAGFMTPERCTAISLMANDIKELPNGLVCPDLNTLLLGADPNGLVCPDLNTSLLGADGVSYFKPRLSGKGGVSMTILDVFFEEMKALKVLSVYKGILGPESLQFLTNLQTLHLDYCEFKDISSLGKLKKLGILRLCGSNIVELPIEIGELNNLRLLDVNGCHNLERIPPMVISNLSKLEELYIKFSTHVWERVSVKLACDWLWELNSLSHLAVLSLQFDAKYLPINFAFPKLERYKINMFDSEMEYPTSKTLGIKDIDATSLNAFKELFPAVEYLHLESAVGFQNIIPNMGQGGLNNLISLDLDSCREMECLIDSTQQQQVQTHHVAEGNHVILLLKLTSLHLKYLPKLKFIWKGPTQYVSLQSLRDVEVCGCERLTYFCSSSLAQSLIQLQRLMIYSCKGLEQIVMHVIGEEDKDEDDQIISLKGHLQQPICFPNLEEIVVKDCNKLKSLFPISMVGGLRQLRKLIIERACELEEVFRYEEDKDEEDQIISSDGQLQQPIYFPNLEEIVVKDCNKLKSL